MNSFSHEALFARAERVIPGGVNSPVRSFRSVGGVPVFVERGAGARLHTSDGRELIDFCQSWGALLFGHADPEIAAAVAAAARDGTGFGTATRREVVFAETLCALIPYAEQARCVSSGTEAVMTALRLARGATGRDRILKFDGCYHGHSDAMLVAAGSGLLSGGRSSSAGVPAAVAADTLVVPYNNVDAVDAVLARQGERIAAAIVEPVAANMGLVPPAPGFLEALREITRRYGALLIFDEVITGFRFGPTTYGALHGVAPDLTCLGKVIGGGLPLAAVVGRRAVMAQLAPLGAVYQAGTLSGNPLAVAAGQATLDKLVREKPYPRMEAPPLPTADGVAAQRRGSAFTLFCRDAAPRDLHEAQQSDTVRYAALFHALLDRGIYLPPAQFETAFLSAAHSADDVRTLCDALRDVLGTAR